MNGTYRMQWPIIDMRTPLNDLLGQAMQDLAAELRSRILRQAAPVEWSITRDHAGMVLVATVPVAAPDRAEDQDLAEHRRRRDRRTNHAEDVADLIELGETDAAIAARLGISETSARRARDRHAARLRQAASA